MKPLRAKSGLRRRRGMLLIECLVYIGVFAIVIGAGTASFYLIWDNSMALRHAADDISGALRAGEAWRADIRGATGKIQMTTSSDGVLLKIPRGRGEISYRYSGDTVWRKAAPAGSWIPVLSRVKTSQMETEVRSQIKAWRWDVELIPHRSRVKLPLVFSYEAVAPSNP